MPTASDFRAAADVLRANADSAVTSGGTLRDVRVDTGVLGGPYVATVDTALVVSTANLHRLAGEMHSVASEFESRATICDQYTTAMQQYRARHLQWDWAYNTYYEAKFQGLVAAHPGPAPIPPTKPAPWAEEG